MTPSHPSNASEQPPAASAASTASTTTPTAFSFEAFKQQSPWFAVPWDVRVRELQRRVVYGMAGGAVLGSVMATAHYFDGGDGPEKTLRGLLKRDIPRYAGRVTAVACLLRVSFWGIDIVRGSYVWERDIIIAAPITGFLYGAPKGPKAAATNAVLAAGAGALVYGMDAAYNYYEKKNPQTKQQHDEEYQQQTDGSDRNTQ